MMMVGVLICAAGASDAGPAELQQLTLRALKDRARDLGAPQAQPSYDTWPTRSIPPPPPTHLPLPLPSPVHHHHTHAQPQPHPERARAQPHMLAG